MAFADCKELTRIVLNGDIKHIGAMCFSNSKIVDASGYHLLKKYGQTEPLQWLKELALPNGVEAIEDEQFINCAFKMVVIPETVRKIGNYAFSNCKDLREVVIADGSRLETIESYCFFGCGIKTFTAPASLRTIESGAFYECKNLQWVSLNEGLEDIYWRCFACSSLEKINLPDTLKKLDSETFYECNRLKTVQLSTGTIDLSDK